MRVYDSRLGKFLSVDPLSEEYPGNSTYAYAENEPIANIDLDGAEKLRTVSPEYTAAAFMPLAKPEEAKAVLERAEQLRRSALKRQASKEAVEKGLKMAATRSPIVMFIIFLLSPANYDDVGSDIPLNVPEDNYGKRTITTDPSQIPDDELKAVLGRINDGSATAEDYNLQKEINRRKKEGIGWFGGQESTNSEGPKPVVIEFIQGNGAKARKLSVELPKGFSRTKLKSHGQPVFSDGKRWITPDQDGHNGGVWKVYDNEDNVGGGKGKRVGTFDKDLNKIGD